MACSPPPRKPTEAAIHAAPRPFDAAHVAPWLEAALGGDGALAGDRALPEGWRLEDVHDFGPDDVVLVLSSPEAAPAEARVHLRVRDDGRPAAARTAHLDVTYRAAPDDEAKARAYAVAVAVAAALEALDPEGAPPPFVARGAGAPDRELARPEALNLALPAPCGQACVFCAVHEMVGTREVLDAGTLARLRADITGAAARGARTLRVNGLDPLAAPEVFELIDLARASGFESAHVLSTFLPAADRALAERLVAVLPPRYRFYVPIYGSRPEVHDAVVGLPGAFERLMEAVGHLRALLDPARGELVFTTIVVRQNVGNLAGLAELVRPLCSTWEVHLPFPNSGSASDRYRDVALPVSDVLRAVYPRGWWPLAELPPGDVPVCVALAHQRETGHRLVTPERFDPAGAAPRELSGTFYETVGFTHSLAGGRRIAFTSATRPCPHRAACAALPGCAGKVYTAYAEVYGLDELWPVTRADLDALPDGPAIADLLDAAAQVRGSLDAAGSRRGSLDAAEPVRGGGD